MKSEPVVTAAALAGLIVTVAALFDVVLELSTVETVVAALLPVVLSLFARARVSPTT